LRREKQVEGLEDELYIIEASIENASNHKEEKELRKKQSRLTKKIKKLRNKIDPFISSQNR